MTSLSSRSLGRALRRAAALGALAATALVARPAQAQTLSVGYAPICGVGTACSTLRFTINNPGASELSLTALSLFASTLSFDPIGVPGNASWSAMDSYGPFGGASTTSNAGRTLAIDFLVDAGFPFGLLAGATGYLDIDVTSQAPRLDAASFTFSATSDAGTVRGAVTAPAVVPEPSTYVLLATGLAAVSAVARRRRRTTNA